MSRRALKKIAQDGEHLRLLLRLHASPKGQRTKRAQAVTDYITKRLADGK